VRSARRFPTWPRLTEPWLIRSKEKGRLSGRPFLSSEPHGRATRTTGVKRRIALGLAAVVGAAAVALAGDFRGGPSVVEPARGVEDSLGRSAVAELVEQFSAASSGAVVRRLERAASEEPGNARTLALLGLGYQQLARETGDPSYLDRAGGALHRALAVDDRDPVVLTGLAQLAVAQHRFRAAVRPARRALAIDPENAAALGALGDALVATGRYHEAFRVYDRLAAAGPSVAAYARVAVSRQLLGRRGAALDAMELALEAGSAIPEQQAWALVQYGNLLVSDGRLDDAAAAYRRSLGLVPGYVHARAGLARVDAANGRLAAAARRLEHVVDRLPAAAYAVQLGDVLAAAGKKREARRAYALVETIARLLGANGVRTELQTALFDLDRGTRLRGALARARAAHRAAPSVNAADAVAWGLARTGRCLEARAWSRESLRLGTKDALFFFHRGMIERCLGGHSEARSWFRRALATDPHFSLRWEPLARRLSA
jgi:tetratricopeptide (TPR) repeat protein